MMKIDMNVSLTFFGKSFENHCVKLVVLFHGTLGYHISAWFCS